MLLLKTLFARRYLVALYGIDAIDIRGLLHARALRGADLLTPIAHNTASNLLAQIPDVRDRLFLIPNSVDGARFGIREKPRYLVERHGLQGCRVIMTAARLNGAEEKGYDRVIDALPLVLAEIPHAKYVLVGGGEDARVQRALERHGLHDRVRADGARCRRRSSSTTTASATSTRCLPSSKASRSCSSRRQPRGRPVVASHGYGCREALLDGDLGITVDPDNREEIASAIVRLLKDPPPQLADPESLRRRTLEHYDISVFKRRVAQAVRLAAGVGVAPAGP